MPGPVTVMEPRGDTEIFGRARGPGEAREAPSIGQVWTAARKYQEPHNTNYEDIVFDEEFSPLLAEINRRRKARGELALLPPSWGRAPDNRLRSQVGPNVYGVTGRTVGRRRSAQGILAEVERERQLDPNAFAGVETDVDKFMAPRWAKEKAKREKAGDVLNRTTGIVPNAVSFFGGMGKAFEDPLNLATLPVGGGGRTFAMRVLTAGGANAGVEFLSTPTQRRNLANLGEDLTLGDAAANIAMAGIGGAAFQGGAEGLGRLGGFAFDKAIERMPLDWRLAQQLKREVPVHLRTPEQQGAIHVIERGAEIDATTPWRPTHQALDTHATRLQDSIDKLNDQAPVAAQPRLVTPAPAPRPSGTPARVSGGFDMGRYMSRNRVAESGGVDTAAATTSSAYGRYQFLQGTWLKTYKAEFGKTGETDAQILAKRADGPTQDRLMARFTNDNIKAMQRAGVPITDGTVYLAHFLGAGDAIKVLKAAPDTPVRGMVSAASIGANPAVFGKINNAGQLVAWAQRKMAQDPGAVPAGTGAVPEAPEVVVRPAALDAERPVVDTSELELDPAAFDTRAPVVQMGGRVLPTARFNARDIGVDAELMQFKSGGEEFGVTERLQGVVEWDPMAAGMVTVWEGLDGKVLVADGHQRLGLAKRIMASNPGMEIELPAFVLREADGITARDARVLTALKNIGEGTGTARDAAKVLRDAGPEYEALIAKRLPPRSALVRDGKALERLSPEAFGAVVNDVVPEAYAAAVGQLAPDPATHMALVELLAKLDPANRKQAEAIIRQALDAGFAREIQAELFGARELTSALFAHKAKALDRTLAELRKMKGVFQVAARNAETLEGAVNRIAVDASSAAADANARALALIDALALRKGNAVNDLFNRAAERLANGERIDRVVKELVAELGKLDLDQLARGFDAAEPAAGRADGAGDGPGGSGRDGFAADETDPAQLDAATLDELEAAGQGGFLFFDQDAHKAFDDPAGDGVRQAADSIWHDVRAHEQAAAPESEADMRLFDLDDGKGARSVADIEAELAADEAAIQAIRDCL